MSSIWDVSTTAGSNTSFAGINIAPGCPSSSVGPTLREALAEVKGALLPVAAGGTADAITATSAPAPSALVDGMRVMVRAGAANVTTTPTFQLNALGTAGTIKKLGGTAVAAGDISGAGHAIELQYVSSDNHWELLNPAHPTSTVGVANGGTGATSLTAHGVLIGEGTGAIAATAAGTAGQLLSSGGASADPSWVNPPQLQEQQFTASGTFTTPAGTTTATRFKFTIVGGGGGGGNNGGTNTAGGGGGGATAIYYGSGVAAGTAVTVTVGAGGAGSTNGGASSIVFNGTTVTAGGGAGAATSLAQGGAGGTATNGTLNIAGGAGANSGSTSNAVMGGCGGSSTMGGGGLGGNSAPGSAGGGYGGGGGGAANTTASGGAGAAGIVLVEWVQ